MGFIQTGNGFKGKQQWLRMNECLKEMYAEYKDRKEILWRHGKADSQKRSAESSSSHGKEKKAASSYSAPKEKMQKGQDTIDELRGKHAEKHSEEKPHNWANLIQIKRHTSLNRLPIFQGI